MKDSHRSGAASPSRGWNKRPLYLHYFFSSQTRKLLGKHSFSKRYAPLKVGSAESTRANLSLAYLSSCKPISGNWSMEKGHHIQDVNKSDIHARSGALFERSALRRESYLGREEVAESVSLPQNSSRRKSTPLFSASSYSVASFIRFFDGSLYSKPMNRQGMTREGNRSEHEVESANRRIEMDQHLWRVWLSSLAIIHNKKIPLAGAG
ncbi:hypothetical protein ACFE04_019631 [Oxalis oulophora]